MATAFRIWGPRQLAVIEPLATPSVIKSMFAEQAPAAAGAGAGAGSGAAAAAAPAGFGFGEAKGAGGFQFRSRLIRDDDEPMEQAWAADAAKPPSQEFKVPVTPSPATEAEGELDLGELEEFMSQLTDEEKAFVMASGGAGSGSGSGSGLNLSQQVPKTPERYDPSPTPSPEGDD